jgi:predicted RNase H-like nuclease (RuvC/YqgF family)
VSAAEGVPPVARYQEALAALAGRLATIDAWVERHKLTHDQEAAYVEDELDRLRRELRDREQDVWRLEDELRRGGGR